jgi:predicted DNA-binding transcriptional regulator YafY
MTGVNLSAALLRAVSETRKMQITYSDAQGQRSDQKVCLVALVDYVDVTLRGTW